MGRRVSRSEEGLPDEHEQRESRYDETKHPSRLSEKRYDFVLRLNSDSREPPLAGCSPRFSSVCTCFLHIRGSGQDLRFAHSGHLDCTPTGQVSDRVCSFPIPSGSAAPLRGRVPAPQIACPLFSGCTVGSPEAVHMSEKSPSRTLAPTALWEMTLPDRRVPGNAPTRPPGLNFAEAVMLEASPRRHQVRRTALGSAVLLSPTELIGDGEERFGPELLVCVVAHLLFRSPVVGAASFPAFVTSFGLRFSNGGETSLSRDRWRIRQGPATPPGRIHQSG